MRFKSFDYFTEQGFEVIKKSVYTPEGVNWHNRSFKYQVNEDAINHFDFTYLNHDRLIGFNKQDIFEAVRGKKNCILTISTENLEFIEEIKTAYGKYVTVIFIYVEEGCLEKIYSAYEGITEDEFQKRIDLGHKIKKIYLEHISLFDEVVIFDERDGFFDFDAMYKQYDYIIKKAKKIEKALNDRTYVEMPYQGNSQYIFCSYAHKDIDKVFSILTYMQRNGCRIWYDVGLKGGDNWREMIADKIQHCDQFILFSSASSTQSDDVKAELNCALMCKKKILTIRLDESKFDLGYEMYLAGNQFVETRNPNYNEAIMANLVPSVVKPD